MSRREYEPGFFAKTLAQGAVAGYLPGRIKSRNWFREKGKTLKMSGSKALKEAQADRERNTVVVGRLYLFRYDAKHKKTLPYWDSYPLIFPIKRARNGLFLGLNLHYAPPIWRAKIMDALYTVSNNKKYDQTTKLALTYNIMKSASKFKPLMPCLKAYLMDHVQSQFVEIYAPEWDICLHMPLAKWNKATAAEVYKNYAF